MGPKRKANTRSATAARKKLKASVPDEQSVSHKVSLEPVKPVELEAAVLPIDSGPRYWLIKGTAYHKHTI